MARVFAITCLDRVIPLFGSLDEALAPRPGAVIRPLRPRPPSGRRRVRQPGWGCEPVAEDMLEASVAAGASGPAITLSGESDLTSVTRMGALISAQLPAGTVELTLDISGLRFADSASIRALVQAARTLAERGGRLVLRPQPQVARALALLGVGQLFTIVGETSGQPESDGSSR